MLLILKFIAFGSRIFVFYVSSGGELRRALINRSKPTEINLDTTDIISVDSNIYRIKPLTSSVAVLVLKTTDGIEIHYIDNNGELVSDSEELSDGVELLDGTSNITLDSVIDFSFDDSTFYIAYDTGAEFRQVSLDRLFENISSPLLLIDDIDTTQTPVNFSISGVYNNGPEWYINTNRATTVPVSATVTQFINRSGNGISNWKNRSRFGTGLLNVTANGQVIWGIGIQDATFDDRPFNTATRFFISGVDDSGCKSYYYIRRIS